MVQEGWVGEERVQLDPEGGWGVWRGRQGEWECGWQRQLPVYAQGTLSKQICRKGVGVSKHKDKQPN